MLMTFDEVTKKIANGDLLHIAGTEGLIKKLPKGSWIGGSTEYFMARDGGKITDDLLSVIELPYREFKIKSYDEKTIQDITVDAFDNGFSIAIIPFDSTVHKVYAEKAAEFDGMFIKNITGWISGFNLSKSGQTPIAVNGLTGETYYEKAAVLHVAVPDDKTVTIGVINIFTQDENSPVIEFIEEGFSVKNCLINGKETVFADYIEQNKLDTKLPFVGDYSGNGVNISCKSIENGVVYTYAPVFSGIKYRIAKPISDYAGEFNRQLGKFEDAAAVFSCNCILNFLYGELEGKTLKAFAGPITFGEIAYQLVNQTLVYVSVV
ncbi:MAG: hypothetical protein LBI42_04865 [Chitinispirillales bacterium]|jgi:hypothetical protein|nr:hypothetical protein [Chitinispirillales bacterium]